MKKLILSLFILLSSVSIFSQIYDFNLSIEPVYCLKNGRLFEYVKAFDQNSQSYVKMSELDWNLTNLSYLGGRASLDWKYLSIIAEVTACLSKDSGTMEDYDWQNYTRTGTSPNYYYYYNDTSMCTDKSISQNTINSGTVMNLKIKAKINPIAELMLNPYIAADYEVIKFSGRNGKGWYGNSIPCSYDSPNAVYYESLYGIDYNRYTFNAILGLEAGYTFFNRLMLSAYASTSPFTSVQSLDFHHNSSSGTTGTFFQDQIKGFFNEWRFGTSVSFNIWESLWFDAEFNYVLQTEMKGITYTDTSKSMKNKSLASSKSACAANCWDLTFGLKWIF